MPGTLNPADLGLGDLAFLALNVHVDRRDAVGSREGVRQKAKSRVSTGPVDTLDLVQVPSTPNPES